MTILPKEPARLWIWVSMALLVFLCIPYFSIGTYEPLIFGIPLWFLVALVASLLLTGFTVYVILRQWRLAAPILGEDEEDP